MPKVKAHESEKRQGKERKHGLSIFLVSNFMLCPVDIEYSCANRTSPNRTPPRCTRRKKKRAVRAPYPTRFAYEDASATKHPSPLGLNYNYSRAVYPGHAQLSSSSPVVQPDVRNDREQDPPQPTTAKYGWYPRLIPWEL